MSMWEKEIERMTRKCNNQKNEKVTGLNQKKVQKEREGMNGNR